LPGVDKQRLSAKGLPQKKQGLLWGRSFLRTAMPISPYIGGKKKRHFTLSDEAYKHLYEMAQDARLSRSETLERLIRSVPCWEGSASFSNEAWPSCIDHACFSTETVEF
jgi:hypothetical protein